MPAIFQDRLNDTCCANLPLLLFCCFYLRYTLCISQQREADHISGKTKAIQQVSCSSHVKGHHMNFWVAWIPLGWNKLRETMKADTLLTDPQPSERSLCSMGIDPSQVIGVSFLKPLSRPPLSLSSLISVTHILHLWAFRGFRYAALKVSYLWMLVTLPGQCWNPFFPLQGSHSFHSSNMGY